MANGILWACSGLKKGGSLDDSQFNEWYSKTHIPDLFSTGKINFAVRFKNADISRQIQYLTAYNVPDIISLRANDILEFSTIHPLPGGRDVATELDFDLRAYEIVQTVESANASERKTRALVTTCVEPPVELDKEFNDWFNQQHLDMVSMIPAFIRGTRYKLLEEHSITKINQRSPPKYATLYEYDTTELPSTQLAITAGTKWSKRILPQLTRIERDVWEVIESPLKSTDYNGLCKLGSS